MGKGCGCLNLTIAVAAGLIIGVIGLGLSGYWWLNHKVMADEPVKFERFSWGTRDEAVFVNKMLPAALAAKGSRETTHKVRLNQKETNHLLKDFILIEHPGSDAELLPGDTTITVRFSLPVNHVRLTGGRTRYLNGYLKTTISGDNGDFEVKLHELRTGDFVWPRGALRWAAYFIRGKLETGTLAPDLPVTLVGVRQDKKNLELTVKVKK